jgi:hypothetical protein
MTDPFDQHDDDAADRPELPAAEPSAVSKADPTNMRAVAHYVGLDLGQRADFSAVAVVEHSEAFLGEAKGWCDFFAVRHLHRWPLRTSYPKIVRAVGRLLDSGKLLDPALILDATGVGGAVADLFCEADFGVTTRRVLITAGHRVNRDEDGTWLVPKRELVSVVQRLLQTQRITFAKVPLRETLVAELLNFKIKISAALNEVFESWRERDHDDLVLATALAAWAAEASAARRSDPLPEPVGGSRDLHGMADGGLYTGQRRRRTSDFPWGSPRPY